MKALVYHLPPLRWTLCKAASFVSQRVYTTRLSGLRLSDLPTPTLPGPEWVRLKTIFGGICGTDLALIAQRNHPATILQRFASFPAVLGHENLATINELGAGVTGWKLGQRVSVEPAVGCLGRGVTPPCRHCEQGLVSMCEHVGDNRLPPRALIGLNATTGGSWAEYFVAHRSQLHVVPDEVQDNIAILVDPIASAAHAVLRRLPRENERVLINGSGIIAMGIIASIRALGLHNKIVASYRHEFQGELARRMGADEIVKSPRGQNATRYETIARLIGGRRIEGRFGHQGMIGGFDLTYECSGTGAGLTDALHWTRSRGTVVAVGTSSITLVDTTPLWFDELELIGANGRQIETDVGRSLHTYELIFDWLRTGKLDLSAIPVAQFPLADYRSAIAHLLGRSHHPILKAVFAMHSP
jgi:threonine dehydrogenase-like Zn-dependent dehydrogenase